MSDLTLHFVRHGESLANEADTARPPAAGRLGRALRARLGAGARARPAAGGRWARADRRQHDAPRAGDGAGHRRGARAPDRDRPDLHELRQSDAFYASRPRLRRHGVAELDADRAARLRRAAAPSPSTTCCARVRRVRERMEARAADERILLVSHYGFLHFFLGLTLFRDAFGPEHLMPLWLRGPRQHGHHRLRAPHPPHGRHGLAGLGPDDLERPGPPVGEATTSR